MFLQVRSPILSRSLDGYRCSSSLLLYSWYDFNSMFLIHLERFCFITSYLFFVPCSILVDCFFSSFFCAVPFDHFPLLPLFHIYLCNYIFICLIHCVIILFFSSLWSANTLSSLFLSIFWYNNDTTFPSSFVATASFLLFSCFFLPTCLFCLSSCS